MSQPSLSEHSVRLQDGTQQARRRTAILLSPDEAITDGHVVLNGRQDSSTATPRWVPYFQ